MSWQSVGFRPRSVGRRDGRRSRVRSHWVLAILCRVGRLEVGRLTGRLHKACHNMPQTQEVPWRSINDPGHVPKDAFFTRVSIPNRMPARTISQAALFGRSSSGWCKHVDQILSRTLAPSLLPFSASCKHSPRLHGARACAARRRWSGGHKQGGSQPMRPIVQCPVHGNGCGTPER